MRTAMLVLALAGACAVSAALAQARILTVQDQTAPPAAQTPPPAPPAQTTPQTTPSAPGSTLPPDAAKDQATSPPESRGESEAKRQDRAAPGVPGRYSFTRVDNGLLRLDHKSGDLAYCMPRNAGWSCEAVPQKGASLEQQIAELRDAVAELRKEVAALRAPPSPPLPPPHPVPPQTVPPTPPPDQTGSITIPLPSREDIARARGFIADTWHRLVDMIENLQKDMMRKSGGTGAVSRT